MARTSEVTAQHAKDRHGLEGRLWRFHHLKDHEERGPWSHTHKAEDLDDVGVDESAPSVMFHRTDLGKVLDFPPLIDVFEGDRLDWELDGEEDM